MAAACAADMSIRVLGPDHGGVPDVVVTADTLPSTTRAPRDRAGRKAVMDQINRAFVPQVLVVSRGTSVEFPNNDTVSHQVYSFSAAKRFQLPLYKGEIHPPVIFDKAGLVVLGCNIHDSMVGYIYVTDAAYFGKTDEHGVLRIPGVAAGKYRIGIWSPRIADGEVAQQEIALSDAGGPPIEFHLRRQLRLAPEPRPRSGNWGAY
jgi:plastocyanin